MGRITKADYAELERERDDLAAVLESKEQTIVNLSKYNDNQFQTIRSLQGQIRNLYSDIELLEREGIQANEEAANFVEEAEKRIQNLASQVTFLGQTLLAVYRYEGADPNVPRVLALGAVSDFVDPAQLG